MIKIFLISGKAESGKNTVADFIANHYKSLNLDRNVLVRDYAFADEVKEIACRLGWDRRKDSKGRELLQQIGAWGRYYNKDFWAHKVTSSILRDIVFLHKNGTQNLVFCITDVRYPNEISAVEKFFDGDKDIRVYKIRIERNKKNHLTIEQRNDSSETSLDDFKGWDKVFVNDKHLSDLDAEVVDWLKTLD